MEPCVSAIIPVFNGERYLARAVESILAQSYRPLEILVVDDGSTDRSAEVARRFGPAIRYIYQANAGAGAARNRGIALSTGAFVAFLDQDDLWAPDKLACQLDVLRAEASVGLVFGLVKQFYSPEWEGRRPASHVPAPPVPGYLPSALLIRRHCLDRVGPFQTHWRVAEWAEWYVRAVDAGEVSSMLPRLVAWRRLHGRNQGLVARASAQEYARVLRASLARRRGRAEPPAEHAARGGAGEVDR